MIDPHRGPHRIAGTHTDIAPRMDILQSSCGSELRKAAIFDSALDPIIAVDRNGRIVEFNRAAERTFGYSASDVIGESAVELLTPGHVRYEHQQMLRRLSMHRTEGVDGA